MQDNQPTRKAFLDNPRAKGLRDLCLEIAKITEDRNQGKVLARYFEDYMQQVCINLVNMNIIPHLHVNLEPSSYADPVIMAEYVAGQWLDLIYHHFTSQNHWNFIAVHSFIILTYTFMACGEEEWDEIDGWKR